MMTIKDNINDTIKTAMKAREMEQVKVLRSLQAAIKQIEIDNQTALDDNGILALLQKQIKQRQESLGIFTTNGRDDLAQKEQFELDIIAQFLPTPLSDDELLAIIQTQIGKLAASSIKDMGKVMNAVKEQTVGRADPAMISVLVKKALT